MIRYSFNIPYYKKPDWFYNTMTSFRHWYGNRNDVEYVIIEDGANFKEEKDHQDLIDVLYAFGDMSWTHLISKYENQLNPVLHRNYGVECSQGDVIVLTNPECYHKTNILKEIDALFSLEAEPNRSLPEKFGPAHPQWNVPSYRQKYEMAIKKGVFKPYVVCACQGNIVVNKRAKTLIDIECGELHRYWFQHSVHNNRRLHWCSVISKKNYLKVGGFDKTYSSFCGYDDDDFRETIIKSGIEIVVRDDLICVHQEHERTHQKDTTKQNEAGRTYFNQKWGQSR